MASRQEEKQRRREERLAREHAEAQAAQRVKRVRYVLVGIAGLGLAAVLVAVVFAGLGGGGASGEEGTPSQAEAGGVELPEQKTGDVKAAARAAGCELQNPKIEGATHEDRKFTAADYKTNPPTSGTHTPVWYEDGIYEPGDAPNIGMTVHTLEHGRVDVQYRKGTSAETIQALEALLAEQSGGYHMLLFENGTDMPYQVAATAWGRLLGCKRMSDDVFDALRTFRMEYIDKGPEVVP